MSLQCLFTFTLKLPVIPAASRSRRRFPFLRPNSVWKPAGGVYRVQSYEISKK